MNRAVAGSRIQTGRVIRPLDYARDLEALGELLDIAFQEEILGSSAQMRQEFRLYARLMFFFHWIYLIPMVRDSFRGFVWLEDGKLVGNVTLSTVNYDRRRWLISNVATHPSYRRRAIATQLMQRAIEEAIHRGAEIIMLDVRLNNTGAIQLYEKLGFQAVDARTEMQLGAGTGGRTQIFPAPQGMAMRPYRPGDVERATILMQAAHRSGPRLSQAADLHTLVFGNALFNLQQRITGQIQERFAVEQAGQLVALAGIQYSYRPRPHTMQFIIDPAISGQIEDWLVSRALIELERSPGHPITTTISTADRNLLAALQRRGFREVITLQRMIMRVK